MAVLPGYYCNSNFLRRHLAIGLESGEILIYSNLPASLEEWRLDETISSKYVSLSVASPYTP